MKKLQCWQPSLKMPNDFDFLFPISSDSLWIQPQYCIQRHILVPPPNIYSDTLGSEYFSWIIYYSWQLLANKKTQVSSAKQIAFRSPPLPEKKTATAEPLQYFRNNWAEWIGKSNLAVDAKQHRLFLGEESPSLHLTRFLLPFKNITLKAHQSSHS